MEEILGTLSASVVISLLVYAETRSPGLGIAVFLFLLYLYALIRGF